MGFGEGFYYDLRLLACYGKMGDVGRQVLPVGFLFVAAYKCERGAFCMTDYEILMIVLTFLALLVAVDAKNRK